MTDLATLQLFSLARGEVLPVENFFLKQHESASLQLRGGVSEFYERSRLHLISTLAQDLKTFVIELRANSTDEFPGRKRLEQFSDPKS